MKDAVNASREESDEPTDLQGSQEVPEAEDVKRNSSKYIYEAYAKVPELGGSNRWYDFAYKTLFWLHSSWRKRVLPSFALSQIWSAILYLHAINDHERHKSWSPDDEFHNLRVPTEEHVKIPAIWLVELFPPSEFEALALAIKRNKWDSGRINHGALDANHEMLKRSREGGGLSWWSLANIVNTQSGHWDPNATREKLPDQFKAIKITAAQVGPGLTALFSCFQLTESAALSVDKKWHMEHEPEIVGRNIRRKALDRQWNGFRKVQQVRQGLHDSAREWLAGRCPGFFASRSESHPLFDVVLLDEHDPTTSESHEVRNSDSLRALGLFDEIRQLSSPSIPKMILSQNEGRLCPDIDERTWCLWGNAKSIAQSTGDLEAYGQDLNMAIVRRVDESMKDFFIMLALSEFLDVVEAQYARLRDNARTRHGEFTAADIRGLRQSFLTLSLDLTSVSREVEKFWKRSGFPFSLVQFNLESAPWDRHPIPSVDMNKQLRESQAEKFSELKLSDKDYREILSTVAALGASVDSARISRRALLVSLLSLIVALAAILLTKLDPDSVLHIIAEWFRGILA